MVRIQIQYLLAGESITDNTPPTLKLLSPPKSNWLRLPHSLPPLLPIQRFPFLYFPKSKSPPSDYITLLHHIRYSQHGKNQSWSLGASKLLTLQSSQMVEAQTWTTRRMSNPRLDSTPTADHEVLDIPVTPTADVRNNIHTVGSRLSPNLLTALIVASWFMSNIGVLLLNKYLLSFYGYRYPIFLTMLHMISCASYSYAAINFLEIVPRQHILSRKQFLKIFALSLIFCFSVVCGNTSLRYIPVSFNQAIGATTPFFTAIFAFLITCKKESAEVYLALLPVVFGIVLASNSEPLFNLFGFLVCIGSTAGRALKSVVQGILLTSEAEKLHSMNLLLYMAPMAAMILLPFTLYIEGNVAIVTLEKAKSDSFIIFLLLGNATVAYLVNLTNFLVTKHTSALTLQVLGNAKAALAASVSVMIFRNPVTVMGMAGFAVTIMGVVLYSEAKKRSKAQLAAH
ncbi:hypothetical protein HRI_003704900 [Hibiscus trionum]|uniref:Sugar phosphate transporter domain-containing protein n=1 Tax=Hibiscus trionum TaxID=183268 RepID=A0A9W7MH62_HIBTR|nr:hypothetical protein HRI_003704900 [Hibiscus trionum]